MTMRLEKCGLNTRKHWEMKGESWRNMEIERVWEQEGKKEDGKDMWNWF